MVAELLTLYRPSLLSSAPDDDDLFVLASLSAVVEPFVCLLTSCMPLILSAGDAALPGAC
jgi:hypothetical protein